MLPALIRIQSKGTAFCKRRKLWLFLKRPSATRTSIPCSASWNTPSRTAAGRQKLEAGSDFKEGSARCSVRVFERYSMVGGNRLSLTLTLFQNGDEPIRLSAIAAGGSQAVFFKMNTLGEDAFLKDVKQLLEEILEG